MTQFADANARPRARKPNGSFVANGEGVLPIVALKPRFLVHGHFLLADSTKCRGGKLEQISLVQFPDWQADWPVKLHSYTEPSNFGVTTISF